MSGRRLILAAVTVAVLAAVGGLLGVASGEGPAGSTAARTVSVEGVGIVPVADNASASQATTVYREGMAKALVDGQAKAAFLAEKSGVALGAAVSIVEDGGFIECAGGESSEYPSYEGEQPDFGYGRSPSAVAPAASAAPVSGASGPVSHRPKVGKPRKRRIAHKAATTSVRCNLTANVSEIYAIG
jgi:hypothetical protein